MPTDLRQLFSELEFRSEVGWHRVGRSQRGDGIKVGQIPVILRWLADQANHLSAPGKPRVVTIWGYEEPENNLETRKCFELAEFFIANSKPVQTGQSNALKPMLDKTNTAADIEAMAQTLQTKGVVQVEVVTYLK